MTVIFLAGGFGLLIVAFMLVAITLGLAVATWWPSLLIGGAVVFGVLWAFKRFCVLLGTEANTPIITTYYVPVEPEEAEPASSALDEPDWLSEDGERL